MTTKQMAEIAGVSVDTITRKGKELFPAKYEKGKKTVFLQSESLEIMRAVRKLNMVGPTQSAEVATQSAEVGSSLSSRDLDLISAIVSKTVAMTIAQLDMRLAKIESRVEERQALLPAPQIKPRDHVNQIVRRHAEKNSVDQRYVWIELYTEFSYRTNSNPRTCAKNRNMSILDYIDSEGQIETLEAVALEVLK